MDNLHVYPTDEELLHDTSNHRGENCGCQPKETIPLAGGGLIVIHRSLGAQQRRATFKMTGLRPQRDPPSQS
jgi:hypothetical protein